MVFEGAGVRDVLFLVLVVFGGLDVLEVGRGGDRIDGRGIGMGVGVGMGLDL